MEKWQETPLTFSEVLDVTFRIIKENFSKLFLIMLIFMGPVYLLQAIGLMSGGMSLLPDPNRSAGIASLLAGFTQSGTQSANANPGIAYWVLIVISSILLLFIAIPMAHASIIIATEHFRRKETVNISTIIRQAFSRFWALLGGIMVYGLIIMGLYIGMSAIIVGYLATSGLLRGITGLAAGSAAGLGTHIAVIIVLSLIALFAFIYLITRWSFFFAAIVFEKVSPGIGKSWHLTRGYFWRLVGLYLVVAIINGIILSVIQMAVNLFLGGSILAFLLNSLVTILISMMPAIAYAVTYFDLRVRNEAVDLKDLLETYQGNPIVSNPEASVGQNQQHTQTTEQLPWDTENR